MSNWVYISARFDGDPIEIKNMLDTIKGEETAFDFNKVIPMPESLIIGEGSESDKAEACFLSTDCFTDESLKRKYKIDDEQLKKYKALGRVYIENRLKYGHRSWYEWCNENWGTKWNACDAVYSNGVLSFETAWGFPTQVMKELSRKWPNIVFKCEVKYEGWDDENCYLEIRNGEIEKE